MEEEISGIENRQAIETFNRVKSWFFEKMDKIDKFLERLRKNTNFQYHHRSYRY